LRPQFVTHRASDLEIFETQITEMISGLPTDGRTVDLKNRWDRYTVEANIEYLFGKTVMPRDNTIVPPLFLSLIEGRLRESFLKDSRDCDVPIAPRDVVETLCSL